ncbi:hypothetical protein GE061_013146 [Apolygus lucorum]|uniref:isoleucine--tRNA ligase n=1 Tax=Apolygus lucorum TaxID=248454 RepID=A0A6A4K224_APOLU|nr:hypothetical protein GE061_013146 [Apolygus lucorum]
MVSTKSVALVHSCFKCHYSGKSSFPSKSRHTKDPKKFSHTISLPKTRFPHRLTAEKRVEIDTEVIKNHGFSELYSFQRGKAANQEFVLHDGPPYANGVPHLGHAINKILKDIVIRWNFLCGKKIHFIPGWDCHGLPIELKVTSSENLKSLKPLEIRRKAREFALRTIAEQKHVFRSWGIMADWDSPDGCYRTFDHSYVTNQLEQFYKLYEKGLIYRNLKPVYWSPSARTALAESELEYNSNHKSTATTISFRVLNAPDSWIGGDDLFALIWTTTPWTLPANQAISYNPDLNYSIVQGGSGHRFLLATSLVSDVSDKLGVKLVPIMHVKGEALKNLKYEHPISRTPHSFYPGAHVTADVGTGLVHTAPSHGHDDFLIGINNNLELKCMVDEEGCYTSDAGHDLRGLNVLHEGNKKILKLLRENILHKEDYIHSYPYDWRTKCPVIIRSSLQWFIDTNSIKKSAIEALQQVEILPTRNVEGMIAQMERRPYWCISRQRSWGVPIPVLYDNDQPVVNSELIQHYKCLASKHGTDFWWTLPVEQLIPKALYHSMDPRKLTKGQDILDIWLDSGLSWSSVLEGKTADVYLEGVDQFTGWFQSSLITSVALQGKAPFS